MPEPVWPEPGASSTSAACSRRRGDVATRRPRGSTASSATHRLAQRGRDGRGLVRADGAHDLIRRQDHQRVPRAEPLEHRVDDGALGLERGRARAERGVDDEGERDPRVGRASGTSVRTRTYGSSPCAAGVDVRARRARVDDRRATSTTRSPVGRTSPRAGHARGRSTVAPALVEISGRRGRASSCTRAASSPIIGGSPSLAMGKRYVARPPRSGSHST